MFSTLYAVPDGVAAGVGIVKATATLSGSSVSKYWIVTSDGTDYTAITAIDEDDVDERHSFYTSTNVSISYPAATGAVDVTKAVTETATGFAGTTFDTYASSNTTAATIAADGTITLKADGTTTITAVATYNGWVRSISVSVTVDVE